MRGLLLGLALTGATVQLGCSPASFFGKNEDTGVATTPSYRRVNLACAGMDISSAEIDVPTFRKILHCFNSNGALEPIENLVMRLSDADLSPIVDVGNRYLLTNRKLLYQLEQSYDTLSSKGILDNTFLQFGRMLENEEFVSSAIAILKEGYFVQRGSARGDYTSDRNVLHAIERLATKFTPENVADGLDAGLTLSRSRAFVSAQARLRGDSPSSRKLRDLTDSLLAYLQDIRDPDHVDTGLRLLTELSTGRLFNAIDDSSVVGSDPAAFRQTVPAVAAALNVSLASNGQIFDGLTSLMHYVHQPIHCLGGSQTVPDGAMHVFREVTRVNTGGIASFIKRRNALTMMAITPFCDMPPELGRYYPAFFSLADSTAVEPAAAILKAFYRASSELDPATGRERHPLAELLADVFADTGSAKYAALPGGAAENTAGVKRLIPVLSELSDRGALEDIILITSLLREEDRPRFQEVLQFLLEPMPPVGAGQASDPNKTQNIFTSFSEAVSRASPDSFFAFFHSLKRFVDADRPLLDPAYRALRQAYYVNDVHPVIEFIHAVLTDANTNDKLFNTLFVISEMPEFQASVHLVSQMAEDSRLKELSGAVLSIFHKFALQGQTAIHPGVEPEFKSKARHDLAASDLTIFGIGEEASVSNNACREMDLSFSLASHWEAPFERQLGNFTSCMNADAPKHDDFADVVSFLSRNRTEQGTSYLTHVIDLFRTMDFSTDALRHVGGTFQKTVDDLRMYHWLDGMTMFVRGLPGKAGPVFRPLLDVFRPIMDSRVRPAIQRLEKSLAPVLVRSDFPVALRLMDVLSDRAPDTDFPPAQTKFDWERLKRWVWNKECENLPPHSPQWMIDRYTALRASQIADEHNTAVTNWDLVAGQPRRTWKFEEYREFLDPTLTRLGDPEQGVKPGAAIDALLNVMRYFTLPDDQKEANEFQHYHRDELLKFLKARSDDLKLITYYYPGDARPRVRYVTTMDRLELVLASADFWAPWPFVAGHILPDFKNKRNFGMLFLSKVADAWGDEPESVWPKAIKEKFGNARPPTLSEAVKDIMATAAKFTSLVGLPDTPNCKQLPNSTDSDQKQYDETHDPTATSGGIPSWIPGLDVPSMRKSLFNVKQVVGVLEENLPEHGSNGMRVMRDLFFEMVYSTPEKYRRADFRDTSMGMRNNLAILIKLVRAGMTREATRHLRGFPENDARISDFMNSLLEGATSVENPGDWRNPKYRAHALLDPLLDPKEPNHELFWSLIRSIFSVVDASEGGDLDDVHRKELEGKTADEAKVVRAGWARENARMKQLAFFTVAEAGKRGLIPPVLATAGPVLQTYAEYLTRKASLFQDLLRSKSVSDFMQAFYDYGKERGETVEDKNAFAGALTQILTNPQNGLDAMAAVKAIDEDPAANAGSTAFSDRWKAVTQSGEYRTLNLNVVSRDALDFFEEIDATPDSKAASRRLRAYLAERLGDGSLEQLVHLAARDPNGFHSIMEMMATHSADGEMQEFLGAARRALGEPPRK